MLKQTLTIPAAADRLGEVIAFADAALESVGCPMAVQLQIDVAVEEIFINIASYAYPDGGDAFMTAEFSEEAFRMRFEDSGAPYDPLAKPDPDVTLGAEERDIGGLGIFIVKKTMDSVRYARENGKNVLTIEKKLV